MEGGGAEGSLRLVTLAAVALGLVLSLFAGETQVLGELRVVLHLVLDVQQQLGRDHAAVSAGDTREGGLLLQREARPATLAGGLPLIAHLIQVNVLDRLNMSKQQLHAR